MKKSLYLLVFIVFLFAYCSPKIAQPMLYQTDIVSIESSRSYDDVWSEMIDLIAQKGIAVKLLDKSSGLMTTETYSLVNSYTFENKSGEYVNPGAYVVLGKVKPGLVALKPTTVEGQWNIRMKRVNDKTLINVNLVNLKAYCIVRGSYGSSHLYNFPIKSTGIFEKTMVEKLK